MRTPRFIRRSLGIPDTKSKNHRLQVFVQLVVLAGQRRYRIWTNTNEPTLAPCLARLDVLNVKRRNFVAAGFLENSHLDCVVYNSVALVSQMLEAPESVHCLSSEVIVRNERQPFGDKLFRAWPPVAQASSHLGSLHLKVGAFERRYCAETDQF